MSDFARPTVTDDHKKKYAEIMGMQVKSSQAPPSGTKSGSKVGSIISAIPKPKGLGNKMFIFTGKKKIIMEGRQREEEKVKTVNAVPEKGTLPEKSIPVNIKDGGQKKEEKKMEVPKTGDMVKSVPSANNVKQTTSKEVSKKKIPKPVLAAAAAVFFIAYTLFWLALFGYISF
jgi:hypothetical protein